MKTHISLDTLFSIADVLRIPAKELLDFRVHEENPRGSAKTAGNRQSSS